MNASPQLSVIVITHNEEEYIGRALASVYQLANEMIVVDSGSTDRTIEIVKHFAPNIISHPFEGFGAQKNIAREHATGQWILHIDADEEVSPELAHEIREVTAAAKDPFFFVPIITEFLGRPLTHMRGTNLRLFRKDAGRWDQKKAHEQIERIVDGTTVKLGDSDTHLLQTSLTHHGHYQTLAAYRERQERYSTADAQTMLETGHDRSGRLITVNPRNPLSVLRFLCGRAVKQFIRKCIRQRGFLDGWRGWLWCYVSAEYEVKMCRKYLALLRQKESRIENKES